MSERERIADLEDTLRDIILGCEMMLELPLTDIFRRYVLEVKRVASAPLGVTA